MTRYSEQSVTVTLSPKYCNNTRTDKSINLDPVSHKAGSHQPIRSILHDRKMDKINL